MSESAHRVVVEERLGLPVRTFEPIGDGWVCFTYEVNREWIVQFPRFPAAEEATRKQIAILPELARELPAAVPVPERESDEPLCMAYRRISGEPFDPTAASEGYVPELLGRFLFDLHMVPPEFLGWRPVGPEAVRERSRVRLADFRERVFPLLTASERDTAHRMFSGFLDDDSNWTFATGVVHADLGPAHVLVEGGRLAGVIDWGDTEIGDPAIDLWWLEGHPALGERMLAAYGGAPDARFRDRARCYFRLGPWYEVTYGLDTGSPAFVASGLEGVRARLA